jgi:tetratricopeptide (TPR) repeat protein
MRIPKILILLLVTLTACSLFSGCSDEPKISTSSPEALKWYKEGKLLSDKFYYREAEEAITKAIAADSLFAMAWVQRAVISFQSGDENAAKVSIARALKLSNTASSSEQLVARMWQNRVNYANAEAATFADSIIHRYPTILDAYLVRGQLYELSKNSDAAIKIYTRAVQIDSTYAPCVMSLGYAYSSLGEFDRAFAYMERYIRLLPKDADPRASYADILLRAGRYELALGQYRASLDLKPDYWYSVQKIGEVYAILGRLTAAEEQYRRALELLPHSGRTPVARLTIDGRFNFLRGKYEDALSQFTKASSLDTTAFEAAMGMVRCLSKLKRFDEADGAISGIHAELSRRNLLQSPAMAGFNLYRAVTLKERGEFDQALAACDEALQFASPLDRVGIYNEIADLHLRQKDYELALDACEEALSLNPNSPGTLLTLLKVYSAKGDPRMVREIGGGLMKLWADADPDYILLKEARVALGRTTGVARK